MLVSVSLLACYSSKRASLLTAIVSVDMEQGTIGSMKKLGVTESYKLKRQVVSSASEAAEMIIRCVTLSFSVHLHQQLIYSSAELMTSYEQHLVNVKLFRSLLSFSSDYR